jgi:hypothetical protein
MTDVKKLQSARIRHYEQVRFIVDVPEDGIRKGSLGTVVGSNGSPVESYEVDIGNRPVVTVHASEIELVRPVEAKPMAQNSKPQQIRPPPPFEKKDI